MLELKLIYKNRKASKKVKQKLQKTVPINLIGIYMTISSRIFPNKNIKIRNINEVRDVR